MERVVRAFPILPGQERAAEDFARQLATTRAAEADGFYRKFGIAHESWFAQHTAQGMTVIAVTEFGARTAETAADEYAQSTEPFEQWFKSQVLKVSGIDPSIAPLGPPTVCVFDYPGQPARQP
jgi:hypothetical protein